jgi:hypothetical protein
MTPPPRYEIVVPSRNRANNMETIRWLLPSAKVCIDVREVADYAPYLEHSRTIVHPKTDGFPQTINWMMDNIECECLIVIDDDFQGVQVNVGSKRFITDAEEILGILENAVTCTKDLGLTAFCFSRTPNMTIINPAMRPIVAVQSVSSAFGIMGRARHRHYDPTLPGRAAVDWTLRTLLEDRSLYSDIRFYFDCGRAFGGRGGNVGLVTPAMLKKSSRTLVERWGRHVSFKQVPFQKNSDIAAVKIAISRTNKRAQK